MQPTPSHDFTLFCKIQSVKILKLKICQSNYTNSTMTLLSISTNAKAKCKQGT
ncbi:hypothetical protein Sjap_016861 [Stephania japonica]|uniref:Uncharacterized protein n=1 Tax=Stephania japonica TaxID=461633 RepID=A0AAP0I523_9MAGN